MEREKINLKVKSIVKDLKEENFHSVFLKDFPHNELISCNLTKTELKEELNNIFEALGNQPIVITSYEEKIKDNFDYYNMV